MFNFIELGLERDGTSLSQIPTYVTGVPNGTEKVSTLFQGQWARAQPRTTANDNYAPRACTLLSTWEAPISVSAPSS